MNYFKIYQKEHIKFYLLAFALTCYALPVSLWLKLRDMSMSGGLDSHDAMHIREQVNHNMILLFVILFMAIASAYLAFSCLHGKEERILHYSKKDIYSSLLVSSILFYSIPVLINIGLSVMVAAVHRCLNVQLIRSYLAVVCLYLLIYLLTYFAVSIAIIITGTFGMSVLYFISLCFIESIISKTTFYQYLQKGQSVVVILLCLLTGLLGWFSYFLYQKRPDESKKKAFVFPIAERITKYVVAIPLSLYLTMLLCAMLGITHIFFILICLIVLCWILEFVIDCAFATPWKNAVQNWKDFMISGVLVIMLYFIWNIML